MDGGRPSRRDVLGGAVAIGGALGAVRAVAADAPLPSHGTANSVATPADLIVRTGAGRVRGFASDGIATFKGIPYGDCSQRFQPPRAPAPWEGVRSCLSYGPICPQSVPKGVPSDASRFYNIGEPGSPGEDCLRANVWTPGVGTAKKRPVLVWIHGGGFNSGSAHESVAYHGESISRRGDLVVVSINHRLNALGFLNLAAFGPDYARSANVGLLDLVLALQWVRDNIAQFGGDPGQVTVMGQSGGGRKICALMAMPAAKGLFHRAIVHSGSMLTVTTADNSAKLAAKTMALLGIAPAEVARMASVPPATLIDAYDRAVQQLSTAESVVFDYPYTAPTLDPIDLPAHPFDPVAPALSADVPLLVGSCLHEQAGGRSKPELLAMSEAEMRTTLARDYGARTDAVIATFRRTHPKASPYILLALVESMNPRRICTVQQAKLKAAQKGAPVYNFQFTWQTPVLDGAPLAHHGADLPFALFNIDRSINATGGGPDARRLAERMSDAWIAFIRSGNPNVPSLPHWPAVTPGTLPTMIFDTQCVVRNDHDREERDMNPVVPESLHHL